MKKKAKKTQKKTTRVKKIKKDTYMKDINYYYDMQMWDNQ